MNYKAISKIYIQSLKMRARLPRDTHKRPKSEGSLDMFSNMLVEVPILSIFPKKCS